MPLIFFIGSVVGLFTGKKFNAIQAVSEAVETTVPVLGKLMGVGMFIQVMTLTGVRGYIVVSCFGFGLIVLYAAVCLVMPAFGAVSSYGAASVLGVPFLLALLDTGDQIVIAAALSFICSMGDLMPPTPWRATMRPRSWNRSTPGCCGTAPSPSSSASCTAWSPCWCLATFRS